MKTLRRNSTKTKGEGLYSFPFNPPGSLPSWPGPFPPAGFCLQAAAGRPEIPMDRIDKEALQVSKEIAVKFIETQRLSPSNFGEVFPAIHRVVLDTILEGRTRLNRPTDADEGDRR